MYIKQAYLPCIKLLFKEQGNCDNPSPRARAEGIWMILTTILLIRKSLFLSLIICVNACLCDKRKKQTLYSPNIQMLSFSLEHTQTEGQTLLVSCHTNVWLNEAKRIYLDCHFFFHLSPACRADRPTSFKTSFLSHILSWVFITFMWT